MKKPSPKSGIRAWESELKKLNATIRKAQRQGIFIEDITIARPKRATKKQVAKLTAIREQIKQRIKSVDEELPKHREKSPEAIETRTRKGGVGVEESNARTRYAKPKEDTRLTPEQLAEVRREAARKAAQTRKKHEAEMSSEKREALRKKRAEQLAKNVGSAEVRKKAARKAAQTRKKHEAEMPPEEREALRKKRAEQFAKNIGSKKDEKDLPPLEEYEPPIEAEKTNEYYPAEAEIVYSKIIRYIEDIESKITNVFESNLQLGARVLKELLNNAISEYGFDGVMRRIATDVDRFEVNAEVILFDSDRNHAEVAINDMIMLLLGRTLTIEESKQYEYLYNSIPSDDDLIPIELLDEPSEY